MTSGFSQSAFRRGAVFTAAGLAELAKFAMYIGEYNIRFGPRSYIKSTHATQASHMQHTTKNKGK